MFLEEDWGALKQSRDYLSKIVANRQSYFWDELLRDKGFLIADLTNARQAVKDTAKEICLKIIKDQPQPIKEKWVDWFKKEYGIEVE